MSNADDDHVDSVSSEMDPREKAAEPAADDILKGAEQSSDSVTIHAPTPMPRHLPNINENNTTSVLGGIPEASMLLNLSDRPLFSGENLPSATLAATRENLTGAPLVAQNNGQDDIAQQLTMMMQIAAKSIAEAREQAAKDVSEARAFANEQIAKIRQDIKHDFSRGDGDNVNATIQFNPRNRIGDAGVNYAAINAANHGASHSYSSVEQAAIYNSLADTIPYQQSIHDNHSFNKRERNVMPSSTPMDSDNLNGIFADHSCNNGHYKAADDPRNLNYKAADDPRNINCKAADRPRNGYKAADDPRMDSVAVNYRTNHLLNGDNSHTSSFHERMKRIPHPALARGYEDEQFPRRRFAKWTQKFDKEKSSFSRYLMMFESHADINGYSERDRIEQLFNSIGMECSRVIERLPNNYSYQILVESLIQYFEPAGLAHSIQLKLRSTQRKVGQSVRDYANQLQDLADKAYPSYSVAQRDSEVIQQFITGQSDAICLMLINKDILSLDEAVNMVTRFEAAAEVKRLHGNIQAGSALDLVSSANQLHKNKPAVYNSSVTGTIHRPAVYRDVMTESFNDTSKANELNEIVAAVVNQIQSCDDSDDEDIDFFEIFNANVKRKFPEANKGNKCFYCGRKGHRFMDCYKLIKQLQINGYKPRQKTRGQFKRNGVKLKAIAENEVQSKQAAPLNV